MEKLTIVLSDDVEEQLRDRVRGKGDVSAIIEEALKLWFHYDAHPRTRYAQ